MKISTIIPIYNAELTLRRCVESFINQTFKDFELILVNDGSTDSSLSICQQYADSHPFIRIVDKENGGVSSARNAGLDAAQGDYITFTDADDEVLPCFLESFLKDGDMHHDLYVQSILQTDGASPAKKVELNDEVYEGTDRMANMLLNIIQKNIPISTCTSMFRRSIIDKHKLRFDERIAVCEDVDFILRYLQNSQSACTTPEANYLYHTPTGTKTYNEKYPLRTSLKLIEEAYRLTDSPPTRQSFRQCYINWCIESLLHYKQDDEAQELATRFGTLCQPYLKEAPCTSFHHRLFRMLCVSPDPHVILWAAKTSMAIYHILKKTPVHHFSRPT